MPIRRTSGNFKRMQANFSCSLFVVVAESCCEGERVFELDFEALLWSVVYSPRALVIFSWTSSIKLDSVTPWTSERRTNDDDNAFGGQRTWIEENQIFQCEVFRILKTTTRTRVSFALWNFRSERRPLTCHCNWRKSLTHCKYRSANFFTAGFWIRLMFNNCPFAYNRFLWSVTMGFLFSTLTLTIQFTHDSFGCWHCFQIRSMIKISIQAAFSNLIWLSIWISLK